MSSHHIVRDEQEPALIITDLSEFPLDLLGQLLEWAPVVVCGEQALKQAIDYQFNLDVVFVKNPEDWRSQLQHLSYVNIQTAYERWLESAAQLLNKQGHKEINVIGPDEAFASVMMHQLSSVIPTNYISPTRKYIRVDRSLIKWLPVGTDLLVVSDNFSEITVIGADYLNGQIHVKKEGTITISSNHAPFIIGLTI